MPLLPSSLSPLPTATVITVREAVDSCCCRAKGSPANRKPEAGFNRHGQILVDKIRQEGLFSMMNTTAGIAPTVTTATSCKPTVPMDAFILQPLQEFKVRPGFGDIRFYQRSATRALSVSVRCQVNLFMLFLFVAYSSTSYPCSMQNAAVVESAASGHGLVSPWPWTRCGVWGCVVWQLRVYPGVPGHGSSSKPSRLKGSV